MQGGWRRLFEAIIKRDYFTPLLVAELEDYKNPIVCVLLYLYSMETFFVYSLNTATREKDQTVITTFGPVAQALRIILNGTTEWKRPKELETVKRDTSVYRGLKLS